MFWPFRSPSRSRRRWRRSFALLLVAVCTSVGDGLSQEEREDSTKSVDFAVVTSPDVPISNLTFQEARQVFLLRRRYWKAGQPITVLLSEASLTSPSFLLEEIYRVENVGSLRRFILEKLYQGDIDLAPKVVASDKVAISFVGSGAGLVSLVRASEVEDADVKVLSIDGMSPGDEGYPLRR